MISSVELVGGWEWGELSRKVGDVKDTAISLMEVGSDEEACGEMASHQLRR